MNRVAVYAGRELAAYGYPEKPWFAQDRFDAFFSELIRRGLDRHVTLLPAPAASDEELRLFHPQTYIDRVRAQCATNQGALDHGPTFARAHIERAATHVAGAACDATRRILAGELDSAFIPIAGFHHARAEQAKNYCVYNDCAIAIELARRSGATPIAYVDVDVHHGDGVYDAFREVPEVIIADLHEDGRTLFPHDPANPGPGPSSGDADWIGEGPAKGTKLNIPLAPGVTDEQFLARFEEARAFVARHAPRFVVFESGADGLAGDPLGHLALTPKMLRETTKSLLALNTKLLVLGGGGYLRDNIAAGWCEVVEALVCK